MEKDALIAKETSVGLQADEVLTCKNAFLGYDNKVVIENISFTIRQGDYIGVLGSNGAGKSTLIKSVLGLLPPIKGQITMKESLEKGAIGYLPQQNQAQKDFPATVWEVVLSGFLNAMGHRPFYLPSEKKRALENMDKLKITDLQKKSFRELSGGQQQRALLARALCATKELLVLDEPGAGLDPNATNELYETLEELNKIEHVTILMVSHDLYNTLNRVNNIIHLDEKDYYFGSTTEYEKTKWYDHFLKGGSS